MGISTLVVKASGRLPKMTFAMIYFFRGCKKTYAELRRRLGKTRLSGPWQLQTMAFGMRVNATLLMTSVLTISWSFVVVGSGSYIIWPV